MRKIKTIIWLYLTFKRSYRYIYSQTLRYWITLFKGFQVPYRTKFYGYPSFIKSRESHVSLGGGCTFRSSYKSNLIGIDRPCIISAHGKAELRIGNNCGFSGTVIGCFLHINIGSNVKFGANTLITDSDWHEDDERSGNHTEVIIGNNVWVGTRAIVLKGVTIGDNSVIGAGSVVTRDIPANSIAAGNPCRVIRRIQ